MAEKVITMILKYLPCKYYNYSFKDKITRAKSG